MRVTVAVTTVDGDDVSVTVEASGKYAPDVMHDLSGRARESLREAWGLIEPAAPDTGN